LLKKNQSINIVNLVRQWLATGWWFSLGIPVSSTNKTDCYDITEILLKVQLNTINQPSITKICVHNSSYIVEVNSLKLQLGQKQ
jgi:hypothetical protein